MMFYSSWETTIIIIIITIIIIIICLELQNSTTISMLYEIIYYQRLQNLSACIC